MFYPSCGTYLCEWLRFDIRLNQFHPNITVELFNYAQQTSKMTFVWNGRSPESGIHLMAERTNWRETFSHFFGPWTPPFGLTPKVQIAFTLDETLVVCIIF